MMGLVPLKYRRDAVAVAKAAYGIRIPQVGDTPDAIEGRLNEHYFEVSRTCVPSDCCLS